MQEGLTRTGCTTATSFREGAGWYTGVGSPDRTGGGRWIVDPPASVRLRRTEESVVEDIETLCWYDVWSLGRWRAPLEKSHFGDKSVR